MDTLGIDIGGSALKGAPVNLMHGELTAPRTRIPTPDPSTPDAVAAALQKLVKHFDLKGAFGCTFPAIIKRGVVLSAANVDPGWIGTNGQRLFEEATGCPVVLINDADAAGLAEMRFGAGRGEKGVVLMLTLGTGIGSALFLNGELVPNTELGHLELRGRDAEQRAAARVKEKKNLSWGQYAKRLQEYLEHIELLLSPDLVILGGGISKRHDKFIPLLETRCRIIPAQLFNDAGIVGAALAVKLAQAGWRE